MATDAGAVALVAIGAPLTADGDKTGRVIAGGTLIAAGVGLYLAGGPLVHASHRRAKAAWMDAGFRLGLPLVGALIGGAIGSGGQPIDDCDGCAAFIGAGFGALLGVSAAMVADSVWLAREPVSVAPAVGVMTGREGGKHAAYGLALRF